MTIILNKAYQAAILGRRFLIIEKDYSQQGANSGDLSPYWLVAVCRIRSDASLGSPPPGTEGLLQLQTTAS